MDQGLKERLIGAAVLVALGVWLIPWVLDGSAPEEQTAAELELPAAEQSLPMRTHTIHLNEPRQTPATPAEPRTPARSARNESEPAAPAASQAAAPTTSTASTPTTRREDGETVAAATTAAETQAPAVREAAAPAASDPAPAQAAVARAEPQPQKAEPAPEKSEPAPRAATPAAAPAAAGGDWMVQLGSFGEEENAKRLAERVRTFGYRPDISNVRTGGRLMYRVRVGPHATRGQAEAAASSLSAHGFVAQVVSVD